MSTPEDIVYQFKHDVYKRMDRDEMMEHLAGLPNFRSGLRPADQLRAARFPAGDPSKTIYSRIMNCKVGNLEKSESIITLAKEMVNDGREAVLEVARVKEENARRKAIQVGDPYQILKELHGEALLSFVDGLQGRNTYTFSAMQSELCDVEREGEVMEVVEVREIEETPVKKMNRKSNKVAVQGRKKFVAKSKRKSERKGEETRGRPLHRQIAGNGSAHGGRRKP